MKLCQDKGLIRGLHSWTTLYSISKIHFIQHVQNTAQSPRHLNGRTLAFNSELQKLVLVQQSKHYHMKLLLNTVHLNGI